MALERRTRPLARYIQSTRHDRTTTLPLRSFTTTRLLQQETIETTPAASPPPPSPSSQPLSPERAERLANIVHTTRSERKLLTAHNIKPIGSRRRRAAIAFSSNIPFHQLPYQCFQEARKVLQEDRAEKVEEIRVQRERIERLKLKLGENEDAREAHRLRSMQKRLEDLKILADINDPVVRKRFEDGLGDMNKPIYRHLADQQWRTYKRKVLMQRITQMNVVPDILPSIDPTVSTSLSFGRKNVPHGDFVLSTVSEQPPTLSIQPYEKGEKLVTIAVINPDIPNVSKDSFDYRCHFLASNIPISPTNTRVELAKLDPETQLIIPWLPPYAQKGLPYQRLGIFVLEQGDQEHYSSQTWKPTKTKTTNTSPPQTVKTTSSHLDISDIKTKGRYTARENFILRSFASKFSLAAIGVDLLRTKWDEGTAGVMERAGVVGADVEFKRKRVEPLPYQRLKGERFR